MKSAKLKIIGVDCASCIYAIKKRLSSLNCIEFFHSELDTGLTIIRYDDSLCRLKDIYGAIVDAGYDVYKEKIYVSLNGFDTDEVSGFEKKLMQMEGVLEVRISVSTSSATVLYNPLDVGREDLLNELKKLGAKPLEVLPSKTRSFETILLYRRILSFIIGLGVIIVSMISMFHDIRYIRDPVENTAPVLALIALVLNHDIVLRGIKSLINLSPVMDSLIALSSASTYIAGVLSLLGVLKYHGGFHSFSFFEASAGVIGFVGLGKYLEERLRRKAFKSIEDFLSLFNKTVKVVSGNSIVEKHISSVKPGDIIEVRAGEIIPVDGVIVEGFGYVDESTFTGEPAPRLKKSETRDPVLAGSYLSTGYLRIRATRIGEDTVFNQIVENVREAEVSKPRLARLADRQVGFLTWIVLALALLTLTYWWISTGDLQVAVLFMATVLTVACPCALGIAIPLVISTSVLKLSRHGLLVRKGDVFERILGSNLFLFDKTGTLTHGKPVFINIHMIKPFDPRRMLSYVCSVEARSEHPISKAIVDKCREENIELLPVSEYINEPGEGVYGVVNGVQIAVGNAELLIRLGVEINESVRRVLDEVGSRGNTPVIVVIDSEVISVLEIGDRIREEAVQVISELKKRGFRVGIVSGDVEKSVLYYKDSLKTDIAYWGLKPRSKAEFIKNLQENGYRVVFTGDGVNDALALKATNIGIAMGHGAEISKEAGDVVIASSDLRAILVLLDFSKIVRRKMIQNLLWAFIYNATLIPLAMGLFFKSHGVFITPQIAAVAMVMSDICVVLNSISILKHSVKY